MFAWSVNALVENWRVKCSLRQLTDARWKKIHADLANVSENCVLFAGNSHAALMGKPQIAGQYLAVNIAVGGSTARSYLSRLVRLHPPVRAVAAVLIIGTNDIARRRHPELPTVRRRFEADVRRILKILNVWVEHVFVAAIPPLGPEAKDHDPAAVLIFSEYLARLCSENGHVFF